MHKQNIAETPCWDRLIENGTRNDSSYGRL